MRHGPRGVRLLLAAMLLALPLYACAQPGMMYERNQPEFAESPYYGPGYGPGWGMGPGMMGGYGPGPGWGGGGYGPGWGMGPGMMGYGFGFGPGGFYGLDLSDEQRAKIAEIQNEVRERQQQLHREMYDQHAQLWQLYQAERLDPERIGEVQGRIGALQQQMARTGAEAHNRLLDVLTPEQREQLRQWRRQAYYGGGPRGGYRPGGRYNR